MPVNITDDPDAFTSPIVAPAGADPKNRTYVNTIAQGLANRTAFVTKRLGILDRGDLWRESVTEIGYDAIVFGTAAGIFTVSAGSQDFGSPSANTWYYLYAYVSSGTGAIERSTTVPDPATGYRTKTGDAAKIYVGCARADNSGNYLAFRMRAGKYVYQRSAMSDSAADRNGKYDLTATSFTARAVSDVVPPHVRNVSFIVDLETVSQTAVLTLHLRTTGDSTTYTALATGASVDGVLYDRNSCFYEFITNSSQQIDYEISATTDNIATMRVCGFQE
jgi:hypothetical protein